MVKAKLGNVSRMIAVPEQPLSAIIAKLLSTNFFIAHTYL